MGGKKVTIILILISVSLGVIGQMLIKQGVMGAGVVGFNKEILKLILKPFVILGLFSYGVSSIFWLLVLSRTELSYAYPMVALGYVLVFFFSWWLFHDRVTLIRIMGLVLIVAGVILVAFTEPKAGEEKPPQKTAIEQKVSGE